MFFKILGSELELEPFSPPVWAMFLITSAKVKTKTSHLKGYESLGISRVNLRASYGLLPEFE